jgi:hypothetical protein
VTTAEPQPARTDGGAVGGGAVRGGAGPEHGARPIGWWLKQADAALDAAFDTALAGDDVDRRGWQILTSLVPGPVPVPDLLESLAAFDPPARLTEALDVLDARGWVTGTDGVVQLTAAGVAVRESLAGRVDEVRGWVAAALPRDDYRRLVTLLEQLVDGLGRRGESGRP